MKTYPLLLRMINAPDKLADFIINKPNYKTKIQ